MYTFLCIGVSSAMSDGPASRFSFVRAISHVRVVMRGELVAGVNIIYVNIFCDAGRFRTVQVAVDHSCYHNMYLGLSKNQFTTLV